MDLGLTDKVVLIPAGSGGLGLAAASEFAKAGAKLAICARDGGRLEQATTELKGKGAADVLAVRADCTVAREVEQFVSETERRFGRIDVLIGNSPGPQAKPFTELSDDDWRNAFEIKLLAQIRLARLVFPGMVRRRWGRIIFLAGTHGRQPHAYAITAGVVNAGLLSFAKALAEAGGASGVLVNAVNPGPIDTGRMRYLALQKASQEGISPEQARAVLSEEVLLKRFGKTEEIGAVLAFLASEPAGFITGTFVDVDGGQSKAF